MNLVADISSYQGSVNFNLLASKVDKVVLRLGYTGYGSARSTVYDTLFKSYYKGLKGKVKLEAYYFTLAHNFTIVSKEADFIINALKEYPIDGTLWIDVEAQSNCKEWTALTRQERTTYVKALLDKLAYNNIDCGVYASTSWLYNQLDMSKLQGYKVWVAQYNTKCTYGGDYHMWQFTSKGKGSDFGVGSAYIDLSYDYRDTESGVEDYTMVSMQIAKGTYKRDGKYAIPTRANATDNYDLNYPLFVGDKFSITGNPINVNGTPCYLIGDGKQKGRYIRFDKNDLKDGYFLMVI